MSRNFIALIFDLDDTLFDTWKLCYTNAATESCQTMVDMGLQCTTLECVDARRKMFLQNPRSEIYLELLKRFPISNRHTKDEIIGAGQSAFYKRQIREALTPFPFVIEALSELHPNHRLFLVTRGDPQTQESKLELLGVKHFFHQTHLVDPKSSDKEEAFNLILKTADCLPNQILCVGDRIDRELSLGKRLGFRTCLFRRDHLANLKPVDEFEVPDYSITTFKSLPPICKH